MKEKIIAYLQAKKERTDNKCGTYATTLTQDLNTPYIEIKQPLNQLYKEGKIILRDGGQGKLIFLK